MKRILPMVGLLALTLVAVHPVNAGIDPALRGVLRASPAELDGIQHSAGALPLPVPLSYLSDPAAAHLELFLVLDPASTPTWQSGDAAVDLGDGRWAVRLSATRARQVLSRSDVRDARLSRPVELTLDNAAIQLDLDAIRAQDPDTGEFAGLTGRDVVVGVVDGGCDFMHPDFRNPDGSTRFFRYWDQSSVPGVEPAEFPFGGEWRSIDIDNELPPDSRDFDGHGSHVMGIAAGNGRSLTPPGQRSRYVGVAPEATLVGVRTLFTEFGVVTGADYIFRRADQLGMPAVVNLSLGNHSGPHRGETAFERALENLTGPGKIIVVAAGNSLDDDRHAEVRLTAGEQVDVPFLVPFHTHGQRRGNFVAVNGWFDPRDRFRVTIIDPGGLVVGEIPFGTEDYDAVSERGLVRGWHLEDDGYGNLLVEIQGDVQNSLPPSGLWTMRLEALDVVDGEIDFWISGYRLPNGSPPRFTQHVDLEETIMIPGTARGLITVGAVNSRSCWPSTLGPKCYADPGAPGQPAFFSSRGPTSDDRAKPDVLAPGYGVVSVRSTRILDSSISATSLAERGTPDGGYLINQGTSMATPFVTGAVALMLQRFPDATPDQVRDRLQLQGRPGVDASSQQPFVALDPPAAAGPIAETTVSQLVPERDAIQVRWGADKLAGDVEFRVYKGFSDEGPFHRLYGVESIGRNSFSVRDPNPEPGRLHVYRITALAPSGLQEVLETLRLSVPGVPQFTLRAPDPNPARGAVNLRYLLAPSPGGSRYQLDIIDVRGRKVRTLIDDSAPREGREELHVWDLTDDRGLRVPAGVYWARLRYQADNGYPFGVPQTIPQVSPAAAHRARRIVVLP